MQDLFRTLRFRLPLKVWWLYAALFCHIYTISPAVVEVRCKDIIISVAHSSMGCGGPAFEPGATAAAQRTNHLAMPRPY